MGYTVKSFDQILSDWISWTVSHSTQISDMTPGSVIRSFCEGGALSIEEVYVSIYLGFRRYLDNIQETLFDFERKAGTKASVDVVFSRVTTGTEVNIPAGTRLKTPSGLRFILSSASVILTANTDSAASEVVADVVGTAYNVVADSITIMEDAVNGVDSVTNALAAVGGVDIETDLTYKNRFQSYIEGLGRSNLAGIAAGALEIEGITSVSIVELFPPVANVNVDVYIDDGSSGGVSTAKVTEVQVNIDGDGTEDIPGYRAAGVKHVVKKPSVQSQDVDVTVYPLAGVDTDQVDTDINTALTQYINTLGVGNDIIYNELIAAVMGVYGVTNCDVTDPVADVTVAATQVGRIGALDITQV